MLTLFKGDDTGGMLGKHLVLHIETPFDLTGCVVIFNYQGITRRFENVHDGDDIELFFSHNDTMKMSVGTFKAVLIAIDNAGKIKTLENALPIRVTTNLRECYGDETATIRIGVAVDWGNITNKPFQGKVVDLKTDDQVLAVVGTIVEALGGTIREDA